MFIGVGFRRLGLRDLELRVVGSCFNSVKCWHLCGGACR